MNILKCKIALFLFLQSFLVLAQTSKDSLFIVVPPLKDTVIHAPLPLVKDTIKEPVLSMDTLAKPVQVIDTSNKPPSIFKRIFVANFTKFPVNEKLPFYVFLNFAKLKNGGDFFEKYTSDGFGIGIGVHGYESKRLAIRLGFSYVRFKVKSNTIRNDLELNNIPYNEVKTKPLGTLWVMPDVKYRILSFNNIIFPFIGFGINGIFNVENATIIVDGTPTYFPLAGGIYLKPTIGMDLNTKKYGVFFVEFNFTKQFFTVLKIQENKSTSFSSIVLGYKL